MLYWSLIEHYKNTLRKILQGCSMLKTLLAICCLTLTVNATAATWTLNNVTFDDGGIATDSFDFDNGEYFSVNISVSGGDETSFNYTQPWNISSDDQIFEAGATENRGFYIWYRYLNFGFDGSLNSGATEFDITGLSREAEGWNDFPFGGGQYYRRYIVSGSVSTVPIPAAAWLFGSALLGLGVLKRKKA
jgi:hypothetical protein